MSRKHCGGFERRKFARLPKQFILRLEECDLCEEITGLGEEWVKGVTKNISASGLLIEVGKPLPVGMTLNIEMQIPDLQKYRMSVHPTKHACSLTPFNAIVKVVRSEEIESDRIYDVGVVFVNIDPHNRDALEKYIQDNV